MLVTWLTQGGFLLEHNSFRLVVDPYLSTIVEEKEGLTRLTPFPLTVAQLRPDVMVCTHDHLDHFDPVGAPEIMAAHPECQLVGPSQVVTHAADLGIASNRLTELNRGDTYQAGPFTLTAVLAHHGNTDAIGLLIEVEGKCLYITADTEYGDDLAESVQHDLNGKALTLMLICINGRWGNMNAEQALQVVDALTPVAAIPMHYGLFAENTADPAPFVNAVLQRGIKSQALTVGRAVDIDQLI